MYLVPTSNGEDNAPVLREFNQCHAPGGQSTGGQFCSTGGGEGQPSGREAAIKLIEMSPEFDVDGVLTAMGPAFKNSLLEMMSSAPAAQAFLEKTLTSVLGRVGGQMVPYQHITEGVGIRASMGPIKSARRTVEKAVLEEGGNIDGIKDLVRASVAVDSLDDVRPLLQAIKGRFTFMRPPKDRFANPVLGYRDILINFRAPNGVVGEIQIHVKPMLKAKETVGHGLYEQMRRLINNPAAQDRVVALQRQTLNLYNKAWMHALSVTAAIAGARGATHYLPTLPTRGLL